jgi:septum formation protein
MLVLASQSPRRREILEAAGLPFVVRPAHVPEARRGTESAHEYVRRLAKAKAEAVDRGFEEVILGADTVVALDHLILEKPFNDVDARRMLSILSGREHRVITGICLRHEKGVICDSAETRVRFVPLTAAEIEEYVATGEPLDKAGGYAIQGLASKLIDRIDGCYFNVVGLPVALVYRHLKEIREYA